MRSEKIHFTNDDGVELVGQLELPQGEARAVALFAHCFTCTRNIRAARTISRALADCGIAVLRFDFTGLGESEGDFADTNFSSNITDLTAAARWLEREHDAPAILVGHSLGGTAVLQAAHELPSVVAVATIGSPFRAAHVKHLISDAEEVIQARGEAEVQLAGRPFRIRKQFLDDLERQSPESIRRLRRALLVFHSPVDETVSVDNAGEIFQAALHPKSFVSLDRADHLLSQREDAAYVGAVLSAWVSRYLPEALTGQAETVAEGEVVARLGKEGFRTDIHAGGHALIADEPVSVGGTNLGPSPYGLLSAALAACTAMTLRIYARHKQWPLEGVEVSVRHDKIHASDCEHCETKEGKIDRFERSLLVKGPLDDAQRARLAEIADKCPVHRTLHSEVLIETKEDG